MQRISQDIIRSAEEDSDAVFLCLTRVSALMLEPLVASASKDFDGDPAAGAEEQAALMLRRISISVQALIDDGPGGLLEQMIRDYPEQG